MPSRFGLLQCIGKAAVKNIVNLVSFGVGGDLLVDVWDYWRRATKEEQRAAEVQAVAQLSPAELRAEVARIVREEAATLPAAQQAQVASYLTQVPAAIHRSLRRPSDPTGTTLAPDVLFRGPEDLLPLLPAALPRFKVGDRPLPGVDWELVELLGVGGFGEVWKARNPHFEGVAPVALKFCQDARARDRLLKHEAGVLNQVMRQGKHKGIVPLLQTYLSADPPCLAYEYIDGGDLAGLIQERRAGLSPQQAAQVIQQLAEIVGFAHRLSPPIVHRDLKPANILVKSRPGGKFALRITDFGIGGLAIQEAVEQSKNGGRGTFLASAVRGAYTPLYASPQQMRGEVPDPRDDVYALGVIWYQMITGDLKMGRPGGEAWRKRLADLGMTPALLALLASTYEDKPADRPASALVLAENLDEVLRREGQERQRREQDEEARRMQETTEREEQQRAEKQQRRERQERELERHQDENLRRWRDSGQAQEWVEDRRGEWDQAEWRKLVESLKQTDLWPLKLEAVRTLLEELKRKYQARVEVIRRSQKEAERIQRDAERRRTEEQASWLTPPRPEPPRTLGEGRMPTIDVPENGAGNSEKGRRFLCYDHLAEPLATGPEEPPGILPWISVPRIPWAYCLLLAGILYVALIVGVSLFQHKTTPIPATAKTDSPPRTAPQRNDGPHSSHPAVRTPDSPPKPVPEQPRITNSIDMKLVLVKSGTFLMGSPANEAERRGDEHQHEVDITRPFYVGTYEVTQEQYERVMGQNPSYFSSTGDGKDKVKDIDTRPFPVESVSWEDAAEFCRRLAALPEEKANGRRYRLPTEAEWEYVCRGGSFFKRPSPRFSFGYHLSTAEANFDGSHPSDGAAKGTYLERPTKVGSYPPNPLGLYDLHGNVWEWCADWYGAEYYKQSPRQDPQGPISGGQRVLRGGSWLNNGRLCRASFRYNWPPGGHNRNFGFRVVLIAGARTP